MTSLIWRPEALAERDRLAVVMAEIDSKVAKQQCRRASAHEVAGASA